MNASCGSPSRSTALRRTLMVLIQSFALFAPTTLVLASGPYLRLNDERVVEIPVSANPPSSSLKGELLVFDLPCSATALAWHNQPVPGGGTLLPEGWLNPATI